MKSLLEINGVSKITREEQRDINGGQFWGVSYKKCKTEVVYQGVLYKNHYYCYDEDKQTCNPNKYQLWCV